MRMQTLLSIAAAAGACALLAGCINPQQPMQRDYGMATRANIAAQIADPEPHYKRTVEPAANGDRAAAANERYEKGQAIEPSAVSTR